MCRWRIVLRRSRGEGWCSELVLATGVHAWDYATAEPEHLVAQEELVAELDGFEQDPERIAAAWGVTAVRLRSRA
jgi:hypothetical protein